MRVDADRLQRDFDELAAIGRTADGGVDRVALSPPHLDARTWFLEPQASDSMATPCRQVIVVLVRSPTDPNAVALTAERRCYLP
jgi:hypothetical protein